MVNAQYAQAELDPWGNPLHSVESSPVESSPVAEPSPVVDPWGAVDAQVGDAASAGSGPPTAASSWLDHLEQAEPLANSWSQPFLVQWFDLRGLVNSGVKVMVDNLRGFFDVTKQPVEWVLDFFAWLLGNSLHPFLIIAVFALLCWQLSGWKLGLGSVLSLVLIGAINVWDEAMITLALVLTSVFFCLLIGIPMGIWMSASNRVASWVRPVLDAMQTTPAFVYLVPIVMLFGIGRVPGVIVTIIFSVPPLIRLTNLGIRQVPADLIEASRAFGASPRQILLRVQLPLATPTIMAGVNQTLMLSLSMVVIASMIAVPGLGLMVLRGIGRLDVGLATVGGLGIVILAILLDRMTQSLGQETRQRGTRHWYQTGPVGWFYRRLIQQDNTLGDKR